MKGDFHVRFCEKFEVKFLLLTRLRGREIRMISLLLDLHRKDMVTMKSESERFSYVKNGMYTEIYEVMGKRSITECLSFIVNYMR